MLNVIFGNKEERLHSPVIFYLQENPDCIKNDHKAKILMVSQNDQNSVMNQPVKRREKVTELMAKRGLK